MKLLPIKYKQPSDTSDSRCTLYALCNMFDDQGFLLYNNVGESTSHNREVEILKKYAEVSEQVKKYEIGTIYPLALMPIGSPIGYQRQICELIPTEAGHYTPILLDFASKEGADTSNYVTHTVLVLWSAESDCIIVDSKKDFPQAMPYMDIFKVADVYGIRIFAQSEPKQNGDIEVASYPPDQLPHIFDVNDN